MARSEDRQLDEFISRFTPEVGELARAALAKLRAQLPGATQMVYDNYNGLVIGFCPDERPSDAIFSVVLYPRHVSFCFLQGADLLDPHNLLRGSGSVNRHIVLDDADDLDDPAVEQLIRRAMETARTPFDSAREGRLIIKSVSEKQRPRRPSK